MSLPAVANMQLMPRKSIQYPWLVSMTHEVSRGSVADAG